MAEPLPLRIRHGYGAAAASIALANTAILFFLLKFLVDVAGIRPAVAGTILLVGKAWDAFADPVIGRLSDRTKSAMGARRPWIAFATVPFCALFAALWYRLPLEGTALAVVTAVLLIAYNTAYTAVTVPYGALTPALTRDYDERTRLNGARMTWSMAGGLVSGIAFPMVVQATGSWGIAGCGIAVLMLVPLIVMVRVTRGLDPVGATHAEEPAFWTVFANRSFRRTAVLFMIAWTSIAVLSALVPFYMQHVIGAPQLLDAALAAIQLSALAAIPLVVAVSRRFEKHTTFAVAVATWAVVLVALSLVPADIGKGVLVLAALVGPGIAAAHVLPWSMIPDVVEADALERGRDRAGAFYGTMTFLEKCGTAFALWSLGMALDAAGYVEGAAQQSENAIHTIRLLIGPVPATALLVASVLAIVAPPVTRAAHRRLVAALEQRRT